MSKAKIKRKKMHTLMLAFRESGLSQTEFASQHRMTKRQLRYWLNKFFPEIEQTKLSNSSFATIEIDDSIDNSEEINTDVIEIILSNGTVVRIPLI